MIVTVTLNPAVDKVYWVDRLKICQITQEEFLTRATRKYKGLRTGQQSR